MSGMWQDVPCLISNKQLYLNFDWLGVDLRTNTKKNTYSQKRLDYTLKIY